MQEMIGLDGVATEEVFLHSVNIRNYGTLWTHNGVNRRTMRGEYLQVGVRGGSRIFKEGTSREHSARHESKGRGP